MSGVKYEFCRYCVFVDDVNIQDLCEHCVDPIGKNFCCRWPDVL